MLNGWKINLCLSVGCSILAGWTLSVAAQDQTNLPSPTGQQQQTPQQQSAQQYSDGSGGALTADQQAAMQNASQQAFDQQQAAVEAASIPIPQRPFPELSEEEAKYLDQFLDYWQSSSQSVKQYVCDFRRFSYDSGTVNYRDPGTNQLAAAEVATGQIRYAEPDKGFYETIQKWTFKAPPLQPGGEAEYEELNKEISQEKWICTGRAIFEFNFAQKILYESEIPAEMQGERIIDSPLPFLFGAKKDQILDRYWVRVVPQSSPDEYWLEAYPKRVEDARMYSKIEVILAKADFLPKAIHANSAQYDPQKGNFESTYFAFENRKINDQLSRFQDFLGVFVRPQTPVFGGWKRVNRSSLHEDHQAVLPTDLK